MLSMANNEKDIWCLEETDIVYWCYTKNTLDKLVYPYGSSRYFDKSINTLLGPVCLGFWRG